MSFSEVVESWRRLHRTQDGSIMRIRLTRRNGHARRGRDSVTMPTRIASRPSRQRNSWLYDSASAREAAWPTTAWALRSLARAAQGRSRHLAPPQRSGRKQAG